MTIPATPMPSAVPDTGSQSRVTALAEALVELAERRERKPSGEARYAVDSHDAGLLQKAATALKRISVPHVETSEVERLKWALERQTSIAANEEYRREAAETALAGMREVLERLSALTPRAANQGTAWGLHLTVKAIADTALASHPTDAGSDRGAA